MLCAGFGEPKEAIPAIASGVAACSGADFAAGDLRADIVLGAVGVQRDFRPLQHHQQFGLVGVQARQKTIQCDKTGAAAKDAIEPCSQHHTAIFAGLGPVKLEICCRFSAEVLLRLAGPSSPASNADKAIVAFSIERVCQVSPQIWHLAYPSRPELRLRCSGPGWTSGWLC